METYVRDLRTTARALRASSPCDARELLEVSCNLARQRGSKALELSVRRELEPLRAQCRPFFGDVCLGDQHIQGRDRAPMVYVPQGPFQRGASAKEIQKGLDVCRMTYTNPSECDASWFRSETPHATVQMSAFYIDQYEVTNALYTRCVQAGGCKPIDYASCALFQEKTRSWEKNARPSARLTQGNHPVVCALWSDARDYCAWAGKSLPTEAQWEKAARGSSDERSFPWGDAWNAAWLNWGEHTGFGNVDGHTTTAPVGSFPRNVSPYGAADMAGNVWEWTRDYYDETFYAISPKTDPVNTKTSSMRVLRGGSWSFAGNGARSTYRYFSNPLERDDAFGFRCVLNTPQPRPTP